MLRLAQRMDNTRYIYDSLREVRAAIDAAAMQPVFQKNVKNVMPEKDRRVEASANV